MFNLEKTGSPTESVTVAEIKAHCRISHTADDTYLDTLRVAAREQVERDLNMVVASQGYRWHTEAGFVSCLKLPIQPVQAITSVTYTDEADASQTLSSSLYSLKAYKDPPVIEFEDVLPIGTDVVVNLTGGFATCPGLIKHAIFFLSSSWFENRESIVTGTIVNTLPLGYDRIINRLRIARFR